MTTKRKLLKKVLAGSAVFETGRTVWPQIGGGILPDYHINVFFSEEDKGYIADIPDLNACSAFGSPPVEVLQEVEKAKALWLEAARVEGNPVPPPKYRPVIYQSESA